MHAEALIMPIRVPGLALALLWLAATGQARNKDNEIPAETRGENESVVINATVYTRPEQVKELLGSDLGGHYIVVALDVTPRFGKTVTINRNDFVLKTDKDGERSGPFAPTQIAGRGVMVIRDTGGSGATPVHDNNGPIIGGYPGTWGRRAGSEAMASAAPARPKAPKRKPAPARTKKKIPW